MSEQTGQERIDLPANLEDALKSPDIPKLYTNGFVNFHGHSDVGIMFQCNGNDIAIINMSFTLAKTLAQKIGDVIDNFEKTTGNKIMTTDFIEARLRGDE